MANSRHSRMSGKCLTISRQLKREKPHHTVRSPGGGGAGSFPVFPSLLGPASLPRPPEALPRIKLGYLSFTVVKISDLSGGSVGSLQRHGARFVDQGSLEGDPFYDTTIATSLVYSCNKSRDLHVGAAALFSSLIHSGNTNMHDVLVMSEGKSLALRGLRNCVHFPETVTVSSFR